MEQAFLLASDNELWPAAPRPEGVRRHLDALLQPLQADAPEPLLKAAFTLVAATEEEGRASARDGVENAYHNREHVSDVLIALGILLRHSSHGLNATQQLLLILAMIAHDYRHNGGVNRAMFELERHSFAAVQPLLQAEAVSTRYQARVRRLILLTDPQCQIWVRNLSPSPFAVQAQLAVEADLLASLMPARGFYLGARLAEEQVRHGIRHASVLATLDGRAKFLSHVRCVSPVACALGLEQLRLRQLHVIENLTPQARARPWSAAWGQSFADLVLKDNALF